LTIDQIPAGHGIDTSTSSIKPCTDINCKSCFQMFTVCDECLNQTPDSTTTTLAFKCATRMTLGFKDSDLQFKGKSSAFTIELSSQISGRTLSSEVGFLRNVSTRTRVAAYLKLPRSDSQDTIKATTEIRLQPNGVLYLLLHFERIPIEQSYILTINITNNPLVLSEIKASQQQGQAVGIMVGGLGDSPAAQTTETVLSVLIAFDPTGILLKLASSLKTILKYFYLNVPFGSKLHVFLENGDRAAGTVRESPSDQIHRMTVSYRARLSEYKVAIC